MSTYRLDSIFRPRAVAVVMMMMIMTVFVPVIMMIVAAVFIVDVAVGAVRTDVPGQPAPAPEPEKSPCAKIDAQFGGRWESDPEDKGPREGEQPEDADVEGESR